MYPYGLIGNCQTSALVSTDGSIDWLCWPRPDGDPVFGRLLDEAGGSFRIQLLGQSGERPESRQYYEGNTNVLITELKNSRGSVRIVDFCPRFEQFGRMYRPNAVFRIVEATGGEPLISVSCRPVAGWNKEPLRPVRGNSHLRYELRGESLRLTTNMSITHLAEESSFVLGGKIHFGLTWSTAIEENIGEIVESSLRATTAYWRRWVKHCKTPSDFQAATIRSALALKLHCYEDTGAILAALTTSLPETPGETRNWDYRFCWLRDAHFVLSALHNLGHFEEMEGFLEFVMSLGQVTAGAEDLGPVYALDRKLPLPEEIQSAWAGYQGSAPVRRNNQAAEHVQNDVYGEMLLTLAPIFFDERFAHFRDAKHARLINRLAKLCASTVGKPDAGLWELRGGWREHTFTNLMCWAGLDRASRLAGAGAASFAGVDLQTALAGAAAAVERGATANSLRNGPGDETCDASLALASILRFPRDDLNLATVRRIQSELALGPQRPESSFFYRYLRTDDFGKPHSAFVICSFWVAQALARHGYREEAREIVSDVLGSANHLGLLGEHYLPGSQTQFGNFPQAYSHVGLINTTFAVSQPWSEVL